MTPTRMCNQPRTRTLACYKPAELKGGYWECPGGHVVADTGPVEPPTIPVTVEGMRASAEESFPAPALPLGVQHFGGETYEPGLDYVRLTGQLGDVWEVLRDGGRYTLAELAELSGHPEASCSARLRDFRKERFGGRDIRRERVGASGLWTYWLHRKEGP